MGEVTVGVAGAAAARRAGRPRKVSRTPGNLPCLREGAWVPFSNLNVDRALSSTFQKKFKNKFEKHGHAPPPHLGWLRSWLW